MNYTTLRSHALLFSSTVSLALFVLITLGVVYEFPTITLLDHVLGNIARFHVSLGALTTMLIITNIASPIILGGITLVVYFMLLWYRRGYYDVVFLFSGTLGFALTCVFKWLLAVPRPEAGFVIADGGSFPSGHTAMATIVFLIIAYAFRHEMKNTILRWGFEILCFLLIISIAFSRIYLGAHRPSEVVAGFLLGVFCVTLAELVIKTPDARLS